MNPLKRGFLDTLKLIKENKRVLVFLIILQTVLIAALAFTFVDYQIEINNAAQGIIEPLQAANYNASAIEEGQFFLPDMANDLALINKNYQNLKINLLEMSGLLLIIFLVMNGLIWSLSNRILKKEKLVKYWIRFVTVSLVFLIPTALISYLLLKVLLRLNAAEINFGWLLLVVSYFMIIGFCLLDEKIKDLFKKIFLLGLKEAHWILLSLMLVLGAFLICLVLVYFSTSNLLLLILSSLLAVVSLVLGKLFLIVVIDELKKHQ